MEKTQQGSKLFTKFIFIVEIIIIILYGVFVRFSVYADATNAKTNDMHSYSKISIFYSPFQDIHVMMFIGFGFLMTYLKTHSWSSVGFNFLATVITIQIYILYKGFWERVLSNGWYEPVTSLADRTFIDGWKVIRLQNIDFIPADFAAAAVLISFGAVLGKLNAFQLVVMALIEVCLYSLNEALLFNVLKTTDAGGSIVIHTFGAYFGLACALVMTPPHSKNSPHNASGYISNTFAMIGTLFLWMFWPSFNSAPTSGGNAMSRAIVNTILSLTGSCITTFMLSFHYRTGKFHMEHILNATLAGGVIIGASCDLIYYPFASILIGCGAGLISTWGFEKFTPFLAKAIGLHDTAGIHNLHGMPGFLGGIISAICSGSLTDSNLDADVSSLLPKGSARSQAAIQIASVFITLGISISSGLLTGLILKQRCFDLPKTFFDDSEYWIAEEKDEGGFTSRSMVRALSLVEKVHTASLNSKSQRNANQNDDIKMNAV